MPVGVLKLAAAPVPSAKVAEPLPARVMVAPVGATRLTLCPPASVTRTNPAASTAKPVGVWKDALAPTALSKLLKEPEPASVVDTPLRALNRRTLLLEESAT